MASEVPDPPTATLGEQEEPAIPRSPSVTQSPGDVALDVENDEIHSSTGSPHSESGDGAQHVDFYTYQDMPDPDAKGESIAASNKIVAAVQFFTRGHAVPWYALFLIAGWTFFIILASYLASRGWSKNKDGKCSARFWCSPISLEPSVASYVGFALFLLLGFRVNESYARYTLGTRIWVESVDGVIGAFCVYVVRSIPQGFFHKGDRERILGLAAAIAVTLKRQLREEKDLNELRGMLSEADLAEIQSKDDMTGHCIWMLSWYMTQAFRRTSELKAPGPFFVMMIGLLQKLAGYQGEVLRIKNYKVAYGYIGHLKIFLFIWFSLLPLALVETSGWLTILWTPIIGLGVIGMETMADELADPFGYDYNDIKLGDITRAIQANVVNIYRSSLEDDKNFRLDTNTPNLAEYKEEGMVVKTQKLSDVLKETGSKVKKTGSKVKGKAHKGKKDGESGEKGDIAAEK